MIKASQLRFGCNGRNPANMADLKKRDQDDAGSRPITLPQRAGAVTERLTADGCTSSLAVGLISCDRQETTQSG